LKKKSNDHSNPLGNLGVFDLFSQDDDDSDDEEEDGYDEVDETGSSNNGPGSEIHDTNFPRSEESLPSQPRVGMPVQPRNSLQSVPQKATTRRSTYHKNL